MQAGPPEYHGPWQGGNAFFSTAVDDVGEFPDGTQPATDLAAQVPEARNREVASGSLTPHHSYTVSSRAKCAAYVAMSAPKTLPAITSLTK